MEDTIAALATPSGEGGIGIVRISGRESLNILQKIFLSKGGKKLDKIKNRELKLGDIVDDRGEIIDEVLISVMLSPKSYTGENVVEINCHGGNLPLRKTLELILEKGARIAEPGEFTKRAFLNGRIDLTQAEAVIDIIRAKNDKSLQLAGKNLHGVLYHKIENIRRKLVRVLAYVDANIDFPDEGLAELDLEDVQKNILQVKVELEALIASSEKGMLIREGLSTVIVGKPNVGKSSLLNTLLEEERAIVTEIPGTTRDIIQEAVNLGGISLNLIDTAGIRDTSDIVERMGVERSKKWLAEADLVLLLLDAQSGIDEDDRKLLQLIRDQNCIVIINKIDLGQPVFAVRELQCLLKGKPLLEISVKNKTGLDKLEETIKEIVFGNNLEQKSRETQGEILITRLRHKLKLIQASYHLGEVLNSITSGLPEDFWSIDLNSALENIGEITGAVVTEEVLETIFKEFCIGK